jgi:hypothetical protein
MIKNILLNFIDTLFPSGYTRCCLKGKVVKTNKM